MKKSIGFMLVALMVMGTMAFTSPALATEARVDALQAEYYVKDITNVLFNPALLTLYPNMFIIEYGTGCDDCAECIDYQSNSDRVSNRYVGATWQAMDSLTLGAYINRESEELEHVNNLGSLNFGVWDVSDPNNVSSFTINSGLFADVKNPVDLLASWQLNSNTSLGLGLYLARGNDEGEIPDSAAPDYIPGVGTTTGTWGPWDRSSSLYGITLGANINNQHEISFAYDMTSSEATGNIADDANIPCKIEAEKDSYGLLYRGTFAASPTVSIVPVAYVGKGTEEHKIS